MNNPSYWVKLTQLTNIYPAVWMKATQIWLFTIQNFLEYSLVTRADQINRRVPKVSQKRDSILHSHSIHPQVVECPVCYLFYYLKLDTNSCRWCNIVQYWIFKQSTVYVTLTVLRDNYYKWTVCYLVSTIGFVPYPGVRFTLEATLQYNWIANIAHYGPVSLVFNGRHYSKQTQFRIVFSFVTLTWPSQ